MDTIQFTTPVEKNNNKDLEKKKNYGPDWPFWLEIPTSSMDVLLLKQLLLKMNKTTRLKLLLGKIRTEQLSILKY